MEIDRGILRIWDRQGRLLVKVSRGPNCLYVVCLKVLQPLCAAVRGDDEAWRWHKRFNHLHFEALEAGQGGDDARVAGDRPRRAALRHQRRDEAEEAPLPLSGSVPRAGAARARPR